MNFIQNAARSASALMIAIALPSIVAPVLAASAGATTVTTSAFDRQFIDMMVPHHQGAVAMARIALARGQHTQLKGLARSIIASQNQEVGRMKAWRKAWYGNATTPPMEKMPMLPGTHMPMMNMTADLQRLKTAKQFDKAFIDAMLPHHQSAVEAATVELTQGVHPQLKSLARSIIHDQNREMREMQNWRASWYGKSGMSGMGH